MTGLAFVSRAAAGLGARFRFGWGRAEEGREEALLLGLDRRDRHRAGGQDRTAIFEHLAGGGGLGRLGCGRGLRRFRLTLGGDQRSLGDFLLLGFRRFGLGRPGARQALRRQDSLLGLARVTFAGAAQRRSASCRSTAGAPASAPACASSIEGSLVEEQDARSTARSAAAAALRLPLAGRTPEFKRFPYSLPRRCGSSSSSGVVQPSGAGNET